MDKEELKNKAGEAGKELKANAKVWWQEAMDAIKEDPKHFAWSFAGGVLTGLVIAIFI